MVNTGYQLLSHADSFPEELNAARAEGEQSLKTDAT
jgi:hypothetical protein